MSNPNPPKQEGRMVLAEATVASYVIPPPGTEVSIQAEEQGDGLIAVRVFINGIEERALRLLIEPPSSA